MGAMLVLLIPTAKSLMVRLVIVGAFLGIIALGSTGVFAIYARVPVGDLLMVGGAILAIAGVFLARSAKASADPESSAKVPGL